MIFNDSTKYTSIIFPFNWGADYADKTYLTEFDFHTHQKNDFYSIEQYKLLRFGLFGMGMKFFYEQDGSFNLNGRKIDIEYHTKTDEYYLTNSFVNKDCISYKQSHIDYNHKQGNQHSNLESINFGYKTLIDKNGTQFYFQPIASLPMEGKVDIQVRVTSNLDLDGELIFKSKGKIIEKFHFPLQRNYSSNITWIVK